MKEKSIEQKIEALNKELSPFYLVPHDKGTFGLCLYINGLPEDYGQAPFDAYAREMGEPIRDKQGYVTYGSGEDWESAFKEAFKDEPNLKRITFDSEGCGFYCDGDDLDMMADFGKRFKALCEDTEKFTPIVSQGIKNAALEQTEITPTPSMKM